MALLTGRHCHVSPKLSLTIQKPDPLTSSWWEKKKAVLSIYGFNYQYRYKNTFFNDIKIQNTYTKLTNSTTIQLKVLIGYIKSKKIIKNKIYLIYTFYIILF